VLQAASAARERTQAAARVVGGLADESGSDFSLEEAAAAADDDDEQVEEEEGLEDDDGTWWVCFPLLKCLFYFSYVFLLIYRIFLQFFMLRLTLLFIQPSNLEVLEYVYVSGNIPGVVCKT
jgi:hypothetical protein